MKISLVMFTDGRRECLQATIESFLKHLKIREPLRQWIIVDDSADPDYRLWLDARLKTFGGGYYRIEVIHHPVRRGFAGAIQSGWDALKPCDFVFHLEDDFTFNQDVHLEEIADLLGGMPWIAQMVLKRQPWNEAERAAGDIIKVTPNAYSEKHLLDCTWTEHRRNFSTNPCLYSYELTRLGFPQEPRDNERIFSERLIAMGYRFAFWGAKFAPPAVEHIGMQRVGIGY